MNVDERIDGDLKALAAATRRGLPAATDSARALAAARPDSRRRQRRARPLVVGGLALTALTLCPLPYQRTVGWQLTARTPDGRRYTAALPARNRAEAWRRARALGVKNGAADIEVTPRTTRAWGSVWAMAEEKLLQLHVTLDGRSDAAIEDDVRAQLAAAGWNAGAVSLDRSGGEATVRLDADDGAGKQLHLVRTQPGGAPALDVDVDAIDDTREPGMTDDQLRDKIARQLQARGLDPDVTVEGGRIQIRAHRLVGAPPPPP
jgi:hypothetical protein